jgi:polar amino acid transport system permease protein
MKTKGTFIAPSKFNRIADSNTVSYTLAIGVFVLFAVFIVSRQLRPFDFSPVIPYLPKIMKGFYNTIWMSVISLFGSMILGFLFYLLSQAKLNFFKAFTDVFTEIIYGTPLLVMIMIMAFVIGPAFGTFNRPLMGLIGIIIYITPYMTNIFKAAFSSISRDQYMAMDLFGFSSYQRYRYIIIPQVIRILMPPLMNNFSLIIKGSALLNVISYRELFYEIAQMTNNNFRFVEGFLLMWALYLVITIPLSQLTKIIDRRWGI